MLEDLKEARLQANLDLVEHGLVILTFGNVSGIDRTNGLMAIKPSGVSYDELQPPDMVLVDLDGKVVEGSSARPRTRPRTSPSTGPFPSIGGIAHAHSVYATAFAQARREIPCLGHDPRRPFQRPGPGHPLPDAPRKSQDDYEAQHRARSSSSDSRGLSPLRNAGRPRRRPRPLHLGPDAGRSRPERLVLEKSAKMALDAAWSIQASAALPARTSCDKHLLAQARPAGLLRTEKGARSKK